MCLSIQTITHQSSRHAYSIIWKYGHRSCFDADGRALCCGYVDCYCLLQSVAKLLIKKRRIRNRGCKIVWWSEEKVRLEKEESEVKERIIRITEKMRKRRLNNLIELPFRERLVSELGLDRDFVKRRNIAAKE